MRSPNSFDDKSISIKEISLGKPRMNIQMAHYNFELGRWPLSHVKTGSQPFVENPLGKSEFH